MKHTQRNPFYQHTLSGPVHFVGRGLHNGKAVSMTLLPALPDSGYVFERLDVGVASATVAARWHTVTDTRLSTTIANSYGVTVSTIEHLTAALNACGVDNCRILIDGPEVPIMDGSAKVFVERIQAEGLTRQREERKALVITNPIWIYEQDKYAGFLPFPQPWFDMTIEFESKVIGKQNYSMPMNETFFTSQISRARTFGFEDQIATLKKLGLAQGGTLRNAILVNDKGVVNEEGLRYDDEFVRHKLLDAVGDLALAGAPIFGRFVGHCSGHNLNNRLLRSMMQNKTFWKFVTVREATENWSRMIDDTSYDEILDIVNQCSAV
ncbi:UDP-3-O-acyl-N-acetylglucosamine deacetylase [Ketobacter alkanivorans]|uniref:UDP-3-O-acyl-N-acetylglucosamine deacetylase n=1 Tax=Ketobacter alkanivorans TaxID=1917421 RepID=A0A2K9LR84_9GAMM|nr:UDP-3-O-acyl-N-acetylglucosamine deacetylase [Ketobacter alkanivorans]AUM13324.1 UDP-3-O-[3-hydroxymyristoyl] N-acetylglucosamine deacetylase [Ketobacter alkanivorans]